MKRNEGIEVFIWCLNEWKCYEVNCISHDRGYSYGPDALSHDACMRVRKVVENRVQVCVCIDSRVREIESI